MKDSGQPYAPAALNAEKRAPVSKENRQLGPRAGLHIFRGRNNLLFFTFM